MNASPYAERRASRSRFLDVRGLRLHVLQWGDDALATAQRPPLFMLHGWMDVGASFQFVVDDLPTDRLVYALDWRGFGLSESPAADCYWFPDYLGDLEAVLDALVPDRPIDLLGHSMGGNVVMIYAGVRPERIRRLINLEGFGLPESRPQQAPKRYAQWLDELKQPAQLRPYDSLEGVAERLRKTNPRLPEARAAWLAAHWSRQRADGRWEILGDPAHRRSNPVLYQKAEVLECWKRIACPVMWVEGAQSDPGAGWGDRYPRADFEARLAVVPQLERHVLEGAGHMLHHDQPRELALRMERFLG
ncbi:alpha/beta hydrolase [Piscinibacter sp. XHJ-5]|uniref:alpha/beta fold hydrolase n=1 Tax=Piscinibacter sp. XHJ-5 TaxID=3037797 RepID=UPI00245313BA|nr:alpha/beta hydrolase [Piscinibacter sp. XHJ-5]